MTKLTKEQLIEQAKRDLDDRRAMAEAFPGVARQQMKLRLAEIALAALTAEPYGYVHQALHEGGWLAALSTDHEAHRNSTTHVPVYRLPLLEGLK